MVSVFCHADIAVGLKPFLAVGTAGTTSTGAIDPLLDMAAICQQFGLWFHIDGAYGAFAAMLPEAPEELKVLQLADSVAIDPHKWLYAPLEAGCLLVCDQRTLIDAFSFRPDYYHLADRDEALPNYYEYGPQNSRGFRALKVWLGLRQAGRLGYEQMLCDDICLAQKLYDQARKHPELEAATYNLSITTFRYVPPSVTPNFPGREAYLHRLNQALLERLQASGEFFLSNAVVNGRFLLRVCVVNFRTTLADIEQLPDIVARNGRLLDGDLRPDFLTTYSGH